MADENDDTNSFQTLIILQPMKLTLHWPPLAVALHQWRKKAAVLVVRDFKLQRDKLSVNIFSFMLCTKSCRQSTRSMTPLNLLAKRRASEQFSTHTCLICTFLRGKIGMWHAARARRPQMKRVGGHGTGRESRVVNLARADESFWHTRPRISLIKEAQP